jgi:hypothetical protein
VTAESELNGGQGYPATGQARRFGLPISLSMDTVVWLAEATRDHFRAGVGETAWQKFPSPPPPR